MAEVKKESPSAKKAEAVPPLPEIVQEKRESKKVKREPELRPQFSKRQVRDSFVDPETGLERVGVTGRGVLSCFGLGGDTLWAGLTRGKSGIRRISKFPVDNYPCPFAAEVVDFDPRDFLSVKQIERTSVLGQYALTSLQIALDEANLRVGDYDPRRMEVRVGSGTASLDVFMDELATSPSVFRDFEDTANPLSVQKYAIGAVASWLAGVLESEGRVNTTSAACTSAVGAFGEAFERIQDGRADIAVAGGGDTAITQVTLRGFTAAGAMLDSSHSVSDVRPFDMNRAGYVLGEGYGLFVLESFAHAYRRGAPILAEVIGFDQRAENVNELFFIDKSGSAWADVIGGAIPPGVDVDVVYAHAPGHKHVDRAEINAYDQVFDERQRERIQIVSIKGAVGSGLASAGAFQIYGATKTIQTGIVPPTANLRNPDSRFLDMGFTLTKKKTKLKGLRHVLVSSHGVGGVNSALCLAAT